MSFIFSHIILNEFDRLCELMGQAMRPVPLHSASQLSNWRYIKAKMKLGLQR
jgi:hypothetical protein